MKKFADTIRQKQRFLITTHVQPDGDGIGSEIGLYHYLLNTGKKVWIFNPSPTPDKFDLLDPTKIIQFFKDEQELPQVDCVIIIDTNEIKMLGTLAPPIERLKVPVLFVDHHVKELQDTSNHLIDEQAGSSGELVYRFIKNQGGELNFEMAQALYVAILTDTGNFRFQRTSPTTHETVADLLRLGVKPEQVFQSVFGKDSAEKLRLLGKTLQNLKVECNGQFAFVTISKADREASRATIEDTESFIGHLTLLRGVKLAALFREEDNGTTKLSLRGLQNQTVVEIAKKFGGGGHRFAAGAKIQKPLQETVELVLKEVSSKL